MRAADRRRRAPADRVRPGAELRRVVVKTVRRRRFEVRWTSSADRRRLAQREARCARVAHVVARSGLIVASRACRRRTASSRSSTRRSVEAPPACASSRKPARATARRRRRAGAGSRRRGTGRPPSVPSQLSERPGFASTARRSSRAPGRSRGASRTPRRAAPSTRAADRQRRRRAARRAAARSTAIEHCVVLHGAKASAASRRRPRPQCETLA